jgi:ABC-2 type transport system ATP-binding protein
MPTTHASFPATPRGATLAHLRGARKQYGGLVALDGVDLEVRAGEVLAVLGANGAGKTTALGLLTGRIAPDGGEVRLFGGDPRDAVQRRGIGVMLQETSLPDTLRVSEHVRLFSSYYPSPRPLAETLMLAGIADLARRNYGELSGGQQRRVQFALAICGRAPLVFVDEPSTGLDVESRRNLWAVLRQLHAEGAGIVLTTHYLEEADALAQRVVVLANGRDGHQGARRRQAGAGTKHAERRADRLLAGVRRGRDDRCVDRSAESLSRGPAAALDGARSSLDRSRSEAP